MNSSLPKLVLFTDLDGTLLDPVSYSYQQALPAVKRLRQCGVPIVFCSHKTRAEQEVYRRQLDISDPFIVENGGAVFIPEGYFSFSFDFGKTEGGYWVIELGRPYHEIRRILEQVRAQIGVDFVGFGDMSDAEVARDAGLDINAAKRARQREYDETVKPVADAAEMDKVLKAIKQAGLNYTHGGRYYGVMGDNDKGQAVKILTDLYNKKLGQVETVGIGDSQNDLPMLAAVDTPILVQKPGGWWQDIDLPGLGRVEGVGPQGWSRAIENLIDRGG